MRTLLLLRGSAGCGKSTWIERNGLKPFTLSADDIRLLCQSPIMQPDGSIGISQKNDGVVWKILFQLLEKRMQHGEFTVIDATNSKTSEMNRYKTLCDTYRYRIYCVDFTDIPMEEVKRRNAGREEVKRVPEAVIEKMYSRFATQKIPSGITVIKPDELDKIWIKQFDFSGYKKIHHLGDIHGCNTALQEYIRQAGGIKDDEMWIFCGDYIDRGIENAQVLQFLLSIKDKKNVLLLEGNHERHLHLYAHDCPSPSAEFEKVTKLQLMEAGIEKKDIRMLYRKLGQCAYYRYGENVYFVSHGGVSFLPDNLTFLSTEQIIHGVGGYNESEKIIETWERKMPENFYQIHGHRNIKNLPVMQSKRVCNLEGNVEFGGCLRAICLDENGLHPIEIPNKIYRELEPDTETVSKMPAENIVDNLRKNRYIQEKAFDNISSFNFTRTAFYDKIWNEQTIKCRGLYLDTQKEKVVARAYDKFFNINERPETKFEMLQYKLQFPVTAYVKENGFLGIVSYNEYEDSLLIATKSSLNGIFNEYLEQMLHRKLSREKLEELKEYAKEKDVSFVFECVDMKNDPHVIEYKEDELFLLDIVHNQLDFKKYDYDSLQRTAGNFGLKCKEKAFEIADWQEFYDWYFTVTKNDYEYNGRHIEGFVIEDASGFMVKLKLEYYNFWKFLRSISQEAIKNGYSKRTSALVTPLANEFYGWVRTLHEWENKEQIPKDICSLRKMFYESKK